MKISGLIISVFIAILLISSCNRNIYIFENKADASTEKFELKKSGLFLYSNETKKGKLKTRGTYKVRDSLLVLNFAVIKDNMDFLPFNSIKIDSKKIGEHDGTKIHLKVFDEFKFHHLSFLEIEVFSKENRILKRSLDFDGTLQFETKKDVDRIQINLNEQTSSSFKFEEKGVFEIEASLKILTGKYAVGCGLEDTGPTVEVGLKKEADKIIEIQTLDTFKKTYTLKQ